MRTALLTALLTVALGQTALAAPLARAPGLARVCAPAIPPYVAADTVPPLTRAEERELRRLERQVAKMKRVLGEGGGFAADRQQARGRGRGRNPLAVPALVLGVAAVGFFALGLAAWTVLFIDLWFTLSVLSFAGALVFGIIGVRRSRRRGGGKRGIALAGMILGIAGGAVFTWGLISLLIFGS